jgi:phosphoribosylamine--glycine ligase
MLDRIVRQVLVPVLHGMRREGLTFRGVLYAGLMITKGGPRVLEFNVRFGDPEAEVLLPRIRSDLAVLLAAAADGRLSEAEGVDVDPRPCLGVVLASAGYPEAYQGGKRVAGLTEAAALPDVHVFHAGTRRRGEDVLTAGGRVFCVSAMGEDFAGARARAYEAAGKIAFEGCHFRTDIGHRVLS